MSQTPNGTAEPGDALAADPALAAAVHEIEEHAATEGWDRPARLFALVNTQALAEREPDLADAMGLDDTSAAGSLTAIEQEPVAPDTTLESLLETIVWPPSVDGCAAVVERLVLPPSADEEIPGEADEATAYAQEHPDRQEVRIVAAATRAGATYCALRLRTHDDDLSVVGGVDLVPGLLELLVTTFQEESV